jgi:FolB domain-containing protein
MKNSSITLRGLTLDALLGWPSAERATPQTIIIDIDIQFSTPPRACMTDTLEDTVCYSSVVTLIKDIVSAKPFRLIEHLGYEIYRTLQETVANTAKIGVHVKKQPPIPELTGGAAFYFGDE